MNKKYLIALSIIALIPLAAGCETSSQPAAPSTNPNNPPADGSTLKIDAPPLASPVNGTTLSDLTAVLVVQNVQGKNASFPVTYEFELRDAGGALVANPKVAASNGTTTSVTVPGQLQGNVTYSWRARATYNGGLGPWAGSTTFRTQLISFIKGQQVVDLLTTGSTVGTQHGGSFIAGQGWQSGSTIDGIDYDLSAPLDTGTVEFDITNISQQEGESIGKDLKFLSMGDASAFGDFGTFRDHPWKMHLVQRADNDGLEIVWRDGTQGGDGWNDHRIKNNCCGPPFKDSNVTHFVVKWDPFGYQIFASTNGGPLQLYLSAPGDTGGFGQEYRPPHHRISLGCYPRGESFTGAIYRNVKITPNK